MRRAHAIALAVLAGATGCNGGCQGWNDVFERMVNQPKEKEFARSDFYEDGLSMRVPPGGAIAREDALGDRGLMDGNGPHGKFVSVIPVPLTPALLERGRNRFDIYCAACHGLLGDGDTPVADKMQLRRPPSLHEPPVTRFTPGQIYEVIHHGYGFMPDYSVQLPVSDRWAVVAYVEALQLSRGVSLASLPSVMRNEAEQSLSERRAE